MWPFASSRWQTVAAEKQAQRAAALCGACPEEPAHAVFLHATASEIVARIGAGEWTASEVLEAYIARAAQAQEATNCLTEVFFEDARKEAQALDDYVTDTKKLRGPLHGVPVSFKDIFDVAGQDSTMGHTGRARQPAATDAELVRLVRGAGGIPFVKTNIPQTMMFFECINPTWGRTTNPYSGDHTSGGSSGGEGALLATDGSALGWGSDIGGSLRIPASFCGIYTLKPGHGRITSFGAQENLPGFDAVHAVMGPMCRSVADVELSCRVVFGQPSEGADIAPVPYRDVKLPQRLRFGYYTFDGFVKSSPAAARAVQETVEALRRAGHECVEFTPPDAWRSMELFLALISSDSNRTLFSPIGHDPQQIELNTVAVGPKMFGWMRSLAAWSVKTFFGDVIFADIIKACREKPVDQYWKHAHEAKVFARRFNNEVWEQHHFDGLIAPVLPLPPLPHMAVTNIASISCSTLLYNVVDSPVGVVPVTRVDPHLDRLTAEWTDFNVKPELHGSPVLEHMLYKGDKAFYNVDKMAGLPIGVQVVGRRWEDEKVVEMMKVVDAALGKRSLGPGSWRP